MQTKKLGIVGGMGPMATSMFFERIIKRTDAVSDQDHLDMIIFNHATMPDRTEAILTGNHQIFLEQIGKDLMTLEDLGVAHIAIPCNTSHFFMDQMKQFIRVPIIDMVEETVQHIANEYGKGTRVGILATDGTIFTQTYEKACERKALTFIKPNQTLQEGVMKIIYDIKRNGSLETLGLERIIEQLIEIENCQCVILACTELSLIEIESKFKPYCVDAMDVLVDRSIVYSGKKLKSL
jgi:aspartate racemase